LVVTYIDAGVLIAAARGTGDVSRLATSFLTDSLRQYVTSEFVRLEVLPKAVYHKNEDEIRFYENYFANSAQAIEISAPLLAFALQHGCQTGISGIDAIHIACAVSAGAEELITSERSTKPIHRTKLLKVTSILP
jgi:predicted nucleic acid-binding protein